MKQPLQSPLGWRALSAALLLGFVSLAPGGQAAEVKGAGRLQALARAHRSHVGTPIRTGADATAVKPGSMVVTSCPRCRNVMVTHVVRTKPHKTHLVAAPAHACPGCHTQIEVVGMGKSKQRKLTHVCPRCGSKEAFCASVPAAKPAATESDTDAPETQQHH